MALEQKIEKFCKILATPLNLNEYTDTKIPIDQFKRLISATSMYRIQFKIAFLKSSGIEMAFCQLSLIIVE